jgi:hypothetical protein
METATFTNDEIRAMLIRTHKAALDAAREWEDAACRAEKAGRPSIALACRLWVERYEQLARESATA